MSHRLPALLLTIVALLIVSACTPAYVLRLSADEEDEPDVTIYGGMEYLFSETENSSVLIAYYRHIDSRVASIRRAFQILHCTRCIS